MIQGFGPPSKKRHEQFPTCEPENPSLTCLLNMLQSKYMRKRVPFIKCHKKCIVATWLPTKQFTLKDGHHKKTYTTIPTIVWLRHSYILGATNLLWRVKKHRDAQCNGTPPSHRILEEHPCQHEGSTFSPELLVMGAVSESVRKMYPKSTWNFPKET